jgi:hypothetical protein
MRAEKNYMGSKSWIAWSFAGAAMLLTAAAMAQPASLESVTVSGTKSRAVLQTFVQNFAAPARISGKLVRWQDGVCPLTVGLKPQFTRFVSWHVKDVAHQVGAPVDSRAGCKPNIEIVFTTTPQALLDNVRHKRPTLLGYHDNGRQAEALAKVTAPIQAWYTTQTRDLRGKSVLDSARLQGDGETPATAGDISSLIWSSAAVAGSRLGDGKSSAFYHVIVVADPGRLKDYEIGSLADYIALLSLTQMNTLDACQPLPSIVNLLASGCDHAAAQLTANDIGFLRGLYRMSPDINRNSQEDEVIFRMQRDLK